jgi:hypothetical protein
VIANLKRHASVATSRRHRCWGGCEPVALYHIAGRHRVLAPEAILMQCRGQWLVKSIRQARGPYRKVNIDKERMRNVNAIEGLLMLLRNPTDPTTCLDIWPYMTPHHAALLVAVRHSSPKYTRYGAGGWPPSRFTPQPLTR